MRFEPLAESVSGISFQNKLAENDTFNYLNFQYMYNGGGVAVGDINNDGLSDIYFTGNQVADKLYLNKGGMKFKDITKKAFKQMKADGWNTGVTMADVNADGFLDIYVCRSGLETFGELRANQLYINNGNNTFTEKAKEYGVDCSRGSNQAAFFDMDNDGDLDLYVMNRPYQPNEGQLYDFKTMKDSDILYENQDGIFVDISSQAGIQNMGFGLGLTISDLNNDGFQDIYVSNDYVRSDFMYINQGNKTFKEETLQRTRHNSHFGMGNDIADFNNDGFLDIFVLDMATSDHVKSKKTMAGMNPQQFWQSVTEFGHQFEYMFNTVQINNGNGTFSEIAQILGLSKTDWSWGPLFADFDNDGLLDVFITNGYRREVRDNDYVIKLRGMDYDISDYEEILGMAEETKVENMFFKNMGNLHFKEVTEDWKMDEAINSNGAAYADLDNDGDLDLVVNNMEDVSYVLENKLESDHNWLRIKCNEQFEGAKVTLKTSIGNLYQEMHATRGFQSAVEPILHFGLGQVNIVEEINIQFIDGKSIEMKNVKTNQLITLDHSQAIEKEITSKRDEFLFQKENIIPYKHVEFIMNDFGREVLIPHKMSQLGPFMSCGDVNGDGLKDLYISGSRYYTGTMLLQKSDGSFRYMQGPWEIQKEREELGSEMLDVDGDGDLDLYVVSGSNEYLFFSDDPAEIRYNKNLQDQLYLNDGKGNFSNETKDLLPEMIYSGQRIAYADYDNDGDLDIFCGGRQVPGRYPFAPRSYLLQNDGYGFFKDVTDESPDLKSPGMITQSLFDDIDGDGDLDLICSGEWMPITIFENIDGKFANATMNYGLDKTVGWWMSVEKGDFNKDGRMDYVFGNIGMNNKFHPSPKKPLEIYVDDFDQNGTYDIVLAKYQDEMCYPVRGRQCSSEQMPFITQKFPTYDKFAKAQLDEIYGLEMLDSALHYSATHFHSAVLMSKEDGYELKDLPVYAQFGPINASIIEDFNKDGNLDILGVGNNFGAEIETIRYDGGRGVLLLGDGKGNFEQKAPHESGFFIDQDVKDALMLDDLIVVSSNNDTLRTFRLKN
jgi:hypothetical protein